MKGYVNTAHVPVVPPEPRVTLNLSIEEYALLQSVLYSQLDGISEARDSLSRGIDEVNASLNPYWRKKVMKAREVRSNYAFGVHDIFSGAQD